MHKTLQQQEKQNLSIQRPSAQPWLTGYQSKIMFMQSCRNEVFSYISKQSYSNKTSVGTMGFEQQNYIQKD